MHNETAQTTWHTGNHYHFGGHVEQTNKRYRDQASNDIFYTFDYNYDHDWRLTSLIFTMDSQSTTLATYSYTETGLLYQKQLHPGGGNPLYNLQYGYNIRNWLTAINEPDPSDADNLFGMRLYYDDPPQAAQSHAQPQYNGNISATEWFTRDVEQGDHKNGYAYTYDNLNRLTGALFYTTDRYGGIDYSLPPPPPQAFYSVVDGIGSVMDISYDKNGNILGLKRLARNNGVHFVFDDFTYFYESNRLIALDDAQSGQNSLDDFHDDGYKFSLHQMHEYEYDPNGNMHWDLHRELKLDYGLLHNMPVYIQHDAGALANHYTRDGRKLGKKLYNSQHSLIYDERYYDELLIKDGAPSRIQHDEGYILLHSHSDPVFYYYLNDHLGNVRSVIIENNNQPIVTQTNDYYPFGMVYQPQAMQEPEHRNKHLYNSKEEQEIPGKWLDYGRRFYDPAGVFFTTQDPLAEDYYPLSPYSYCAGNPIACRDENGEWINFVVGAVVGAATDYAVQVVTNVVENGGEITMDAFTNVDGGSIALSAGTGAMGVGIASGVSKLTKVAKVAQVAAKSKTAAKAVQGTANVVGDVTSSVAGSVVQENEVTVEGVAADVLGGTVGRKVSTNVTNKAQPKQKVLNNQADRAQRVANGSSRQSRVNNAASTQQKANNHQNMTKARAATAGGVSSNATSKTAGAVVNTQKDDENR